MVSHPEDLPTRFAEAWNAGDADQIADLFAADADFVNVVGLWWRTRSAIREAHDYGLRNFFRGAKLSIRRIAVRRVSDDLAVVHARWRLDGQHAPGGVAGDPRRGIMIFVANRRDGDWTVVAAQNTDIVPGAESIAAQGADRYPVNYRAQTD